MTVAPVNAPLDDWVTRLADEAVAFAEQNDAPVKVASGISPSGPIHLGNLREVMVPHLVADELRRRGRTVEHIISWDDFDRFRKVPTIDGVDETWEQHIGKPLTRVPAPYGSDAANWAEHFRRELETALVELGVTYRGISQTQMYSSGAYIDQVLHAMAERQRIDAILERYRTLDKAKKGGVTVDQPEADAEAADAASGSADEADGSGDSGYYPYKPYCSVCGTDFTTVIGYDDESTALKYQCRCGHTETVILREHTDGKLVWKVDWPMRWAFEKITFEPSGVDHQSPGSSFAVGKDVAPIFGWRRPLGPMYAFVGIRGMAKMSSSKGGVPTAAIALRYLEPPLLRWLYGRKKPNQSFDVALDGELPRTYDEWDALTRKVAGDKAQPGDIAAYARAASVADPVEGQVRALALTPRTMPYRTLASVVDITTGDDEQTLRILGALEPDEPLTGLDVLRPRLDKATTWVAEQMPAQERTVVRTAPDTDLLRGLTDDERAALRLLLDGSGTPAPEGLGRLEDDWTLAGITHQVYGVAKVQRGLGADQIVKGDKELGAAQRAFFVLLYRLLVGGDTGPRLPTLLLAIGAKRVRELVASDRIQPN
ncbi:lysine--tRNA ligase [Tsukamurella paurometabola]|uniref:Lysine--tRNA ligase n=1 Tax=Tsukamurella paurometabola (strain ATCC 8368 / DSM 20162 / CCUG 35730 / CIP 100753 / JCM 10117 / KCTC 9821 / NBRC 16120 / NCIMB 702349 / NCTC 13040) TaxID=521096 RepID=D5USE4_TSUPD|nr:lysine--tRNA ligase [Tsukamurella paurometabola]ADG77211.1 lysyl-tRNA synthetase [Tsukamurella paurometabola DSM 20162]